MATVTARIEKYSVPEPNTGCVLWVGAATNDGHFYGRVWDDRVGKVRLAHVVSFELESGACVDSANGDCVLHHCDTPACVNPDHLFLGTRAINNADMRRKGRMALGERHGHAKVSAIDVVNIRDAVASGKSMRTVGAMYKITHEAVSKIVHRETWKEVL